MADSEAQRNPTIKLNNFNKCYNFLKLDKTKLSTQNPKDIIIEKDEDKTESLIQPQPEAVPSSRAEHEYIVQDYDDSCEDFSKIEKIISLRRNSCKYFFFMLLSILTVGVINLFLIWFPKLKLTFIYSLCDISEATYFGVFGMDGKFYIVESENLTLPELTNSHLKKYCIFNVVESKIKLMEFKLFKYIYIPSEKAFVSLKFTIKTSLETLHKSFTGGLSPWEVIHQRSIFGVCDLNINVDSVFKLILDEISDPFYLFQIFSVGLWYWEEYWKYSTVIVVTTLASLFVSVYETRVNLLNVQKMAKYSCPVTIYRKDEKGEKIPEKVESTELLPGDLFELPEDEKAMPCDTILINGTVIINESMLTGESTPIIKSHIPNTKKVFDPKVDKKYILYAGTKIVQKRAIGGSKVLGLVLSTGFNTEKGNLIRSILYPKETEFRFQKDSVKYILFMAAFTIFGFAASLPFLIQNGFGLSDIIQRSLDLITTTVPPALPACLGIGISYAISRLKEKGITCIARERVNIAGRVNMICFDKTGTLTEDHLDIFGFRPVKYINNTFVFENFHDNLEPVVEENYNYYRERMLNKDNEHWKMNKHKDINSYFVENLATCHSLTKVNNKLMGDPIDIRMFESTGWILNENLENEENYDQLITTFVRPGHETDLKEKLSKEGVDEDLVIKSHYEVGIVRRFEFTSKLMRMSVLVKNVNEPYFKVYTKGSPEKIKELCRPDTVPQNFTSILSKYTMKGLRVLALSMKMVKMDYMNSQKVEREKIETNMIFLGLLIVQNKVKVQTKPSLEILANARLKMVMATGDNMLTAISVAKECCLIKPEAPIFMAEIDQDNKLTWNPVETFMEEDEKMETINKFNTSMRIIILIVEATESSNSKYMRNFLPDSYHFKDEYSKRVRDSHQPKDVYDKADQEKAEHNDAEVFRIDLEVDQLVNLHNDDSQVVAITGATFEKLWKFHNKYKASKDENMKKYYDIFRLVLKNAAIYARMAPEHKTMLVESLREEEFTVCMCGDGANDCGALRAADVGVSLSLEEASIAAHFTSNIPDISCIIKVLREGKASLVTSIQCFKYMMLYSLIQFFAVTLLMVLNSYLSDNQFLICDLFIIFPIAIFLARTGAYEKLTYHIPTGALISMPIVSSIIMQAIIQFAAQFGIYYVMSLQSWYTPTGPSTNDDVDPSPENTSIFLISNFQYIVTAVAFSISRPFKKPIYSNFILTGYLLLSIAYSYYIIIHPDPFNFKLLDMATFGDNNFIFFIILFTLVNFILSYIVEKLIVPCVSEAWKNRNIRKFKEQLHKEQTANLNQLYKIKVAS